MMEHNDRPMLLLAEPDTVRPVYRRRSRAKHLKKHKRRMLIRLAVFCLAMTVVTILMPVGGSFSFYTSSGTVETNPMAAAKFTPDVTYITDSVKNGNKADYGLSDTDIVVAAFTVSDGTGGNLSEVKLDCDVSLQLQGKVKVNIDGSTFTVVPEDQDKLNALDNLKVKMMCNISGSYTELTNNYSAPMTMAMIPVDQTKNLNGDWHFDLGNDFQSGKTVTCVIAVDTSGFTYTGSDSFTFGKPDGTPDGYQNLTVTVNQVD